MSVLTACQSAAKRLRIAVPSAVANTSQKDAQALFEHANETGKALLWSHDWQAVTKAASFAASATSAQPLLTTIASDYLRMRNDGLFNRTQSRRYIGPVDPQRYEHDLSMISSVSADIWYLQENRIYIRPPPSAGNVIAFRYISAKWVYGTGDTAPTKTAFSADSDTSVFDEELLCLGIIWRFKQGIGDAYAEDFVKFETFLKAVAARSTPGQTITLGSGGAVTPLCVNIKDGSWVVS